MPTKSTTPRRRRKPSDKPSKPAGSPIWPNPAGHWCKKINGKVVYFGAWRRRVNGKYVTLPANGGYEHALARYEQEIQGIRQDIRVGRKPRTGPGTATDSDAITIADLCNLFLNSVLSKVHDSNRSLRTYGDYRNTTALIVKKFGGSRTVESLEPQDFAQLQAAIPKKWGVTKRGKFIRTTKTIFKYARTNNLIANEVAFGSDFEPPSKRVMRQHKNAGPKKMFSPAEINLVLDALEGREVTIRDAGRREKVKLKANPQLRAIVLLGINGGLGNTDLGNCQLSNIDLDARWIDYPRSKTAFPRRFPLWPETVKAIELHLKTRRKAKRPEDAHCLFLNRAGARMVQERLSEIKKGGLVVDIKPWNQDYISEQFSAALKALGIKREGVGFYALRHTFSTIALKCGDRDAVRAVMGHAENDMLENYDEEGPDSDRIARVVNHVRKWLFRIESIRRKRPR